MKTMTNANTNIHQATRNFFKELFRKDDNVQAVVDIESPELILQLAELPGSTTEDLSRLHCRPTENCIESIRQKVLVYTEVVSKAEILTQAIPFDDSPNIPLQVLSWQVVFAFRPFGVYVSAKLKKGNSSERAEVSEIEKLFPILRHVDRIVLCVNAEGKMPQQLEIVRQFQQDMASLLQNQALVRFVDANGKTVESD
jgi:hypothetical protein